MLKKSVIRKLNSSLQTKVQQSTHREIWKLLMAYNNTQKFYSPPIANSPTYCHLQRVCHLGILLWNCRFLKDFLSYSTNGRALPLDCYFSGGVVLSWHWECSDSCWTGCHRSKGSPCKLTEGRAEIILSISKRKREPCKSPAVAQEPVREPGAHSRPCSASCGISTSRLLSLQAAPWHWPICRRAGGPATCAAHSPPRVLPELWDWTSGRESEPLGPETEPLGQATMGSNTLGMMP